MSNPHDSGAAFDVIVVGGGLAGLSAAALVAQAGRSVMLLEKARQPGGLATTQDRHGVLFNMGPHALYRGGHTARLLRTLDVAVSGRVPSTGRPRMVDACQVFDLPAGTGSLLFSRYLGLREKVRLVRFLTQVKQLDTTPLRGTSVADWMEREFGPGHLASLLSTLFRVSTYAADLDRLSAAVALDQLRLALVDNVLYLDGGWQTIVDGLRMRAEQAGARIRTGARAVAVQTDGPLFSVRLATGEPLSGRAVILAVEPSAVRELLDLPADSAFARWDETRRPIRAACLDLALDRLPRPGDRFAVGLDSPLYFSVHSAAARLAADGIAVVHVMKYLEARASEAGEDVERELQAFLERLQPGWRAHVRERRFLPNMTVAHALPEAASGGLAGRPGVAIADRPGVFLAGDWAGDRGMLADASAASAEEAARLALDHLSSSRGDLAGRLLHAER